MLCLGIDVSGRALSAAIMEAGPGQARLVGELSLDTGKNHSLALLPLLDQLLRYSSLSLERMDGFSVTAGPGSFTGLRIGMATVQAWMQALDKPALAVPSTRAMARAMDKEGLVCPVFDARRSQVYAAVWRQEQRLSPDLALAPQELIDLLRSYDQPVYMAGDGLDPWYGDFAQGLGDRFRPLPPERRLNMAAATAAIGLEGLLRGESTPIEDMLPIYLRLSEAEEKLLQKNHG